MQNRLNVILEKIQTRDTVWLEEYGINAKEKGEYWVLNYSQIASKNPYNVLTRGLVIKNQVIISCPFFRFFNYGEPEVAKVNFTNADVIEKLDGSLVGVCFPEGDYTKPIWHFRNLLSAHKQDREFAIKGFLSDEESLLLQSVEPYLNTVQFSNLEYGNTIFRDPTYLSTHSFTFEYISKVNPIITQYKPEQYGLYLIGCRHLPTLDEYDEYELDDLAKLLNVRRPRRWSASSYEEVLTMMATHPPDYEGFVIRDRETGARLKIKSEDYLRRHRLLGQLNYKNLIPLWFAGERGEIEATMPTTKQIFDEIEVAYRDFVEKCLDVLTYWQNKNVSRKEVALGIVGKESREVCAVVFKLIDTHKDQLTAVEKAVKAIRVEVLINAWHLKDDIVEHVVDEVLS